MQHSPQPPPQVSPNTSSPTLHSPSSPDTSPTTPTTTKRGVRFVEDGKEDQVPLAYVLRTKKKREEKAKFLREQQERRAWEEEKRKQDLERMQREKERREWEKERKIWEKEKKAIEDERKARLYTEEVAAARKRRETARAGVGGTHVPSSSSMASVSAREPDSRSLRESKKYSRPVYNWPQNSRRQASEPSPHNESSGNNSRPPSIAGQGLIRHSRPLSVYSAHTLSSAKDLRLRKGSGSLSGKRASMDRSSSQRPVSERAATYPSGDDWLWLEGRKTQTNQTTTKQMRRES